MESAAQLYDHWEQLSELTAAGSIGLIGMKFGCAVYRLVNNSQLKRNELV